MTAKDLSVLFVCIGNTCRSPMAESVFLHKIQQHNLNWHADSAGLRNWNVGYAPEERCIQVLSENGLETEHIGRMINSCDFSQFDYILGMDLSNLNELQCMSEKLGGTHKAKIGLLGDYLEREEDRVIPDPYFSRGIEAFRHVYTQIDESCEKFIQKYKN